MYQMVVVIESLRVLTQGCARCSQYLPTVQWYKNGAKAGCAFEDLSNKDYLKRGWHLLKIIT